MSGALLVYITVVANLEYIGFNIRVRSHGRARGTQDAIGGARLKNVIYRCFIT